MKPASSARPVDLDRAGQNIATTARQPISRAGGSTPAGNSDPTSTAIATVTTTSTKPTENRNPRRPSGEVEVRMRPSPSRRSGSPGERSDRALRPRRVSASRVDERPYAHCSPPRLGAVMGRGLIGTILGIIETDRLILRPFADADADRVLDIHSRLEVIRWLSDPPYVPMADLDEARARDRQLGHRRRRAVRTVGLAIEVKESGAVAGAVMLTGCRSPSTRTPDPLAPASRLGRSRLCHRGRHAPCWTDAFARTSTRSGATRSRQRSRPPRVAERLWPPRPLGVVPDPWFAGDGARISCPREEWLNR